MLAIRFAHGPVSSPGKLMLPSGQFLQPAEERGWVNAENVSRLRLVVSGGCQYLLDIFVFVLAQSHKLVAGWRNIIAQDSSFFLWQFLVIANFFGQEDSVDIAVGGQDHCPLDHIL